MHAANEAQKSPVLMRHGSVAVVGERFWVDHNHKGHSKDGFITNSCTCHAEIASCVICFILADEYIWKTQ